MSKNLQEAARAYFDATPHDYRESTVGDALRAALAAEASPTREELLAFAGRVAALTVSGQSIESLMAESAALLRRNGDK